MAPNLKATTPTIPENTDMARPRSFDIEDALEKAMHVFWEHGYEGASLPDLLDGMGLTRGSLYKAFTDKKTLFMQVLERYERQAVQAGVAMLNDPSVPIVMMPPVDSVT